MNRLIANILILVMLTTQSAWAMFGNSLDADSKQAFQQQVSLSISLELTGHNEPVNASEEHIQYPHDTTADACDHFCHGSVHLQGLSSSNRINFQSIPAIFDRILVTIKHSLNEPPVNPPPIS